MPRLVSEISSGQQFSRSAADGKLADSQVRSFRILLNQPGETVDVQAACGILIGDRHPVNTNVYCVSWDVKFDGESRMVLVATFNYQSTPSSRPGQDNNDQPPDVRPANWSASTAIAEMPVQFWDEIGRTGFTIAKGIPAVNGAGDMYDGVSRFEAVVTISIEQFESSDPFRHSLYAGSVNKDQIRIGSLVCFPGSLMFRGVQCRPTVESWGAAVYRGWSATYEFMFRRNYVTGLFDPLDGVKYDEAIGWDLAVPHTGFNVLCDLNAVNVEKSGMPLKHTESGKIDGWPNNVSLMAGVAAGQKARAMVLVHSYADGGASQMPSAQPIPLNRDGTPRIHTADPKVLVFRYRPNDAINFLETFGLRLE